MGRTIMKIQRNDIDIYTTQVNHGVHWSIQNISVLVTYTPRPAAARAGRARKRCLRAETKADRRNLTPTTPALQASSAGIRHRPACAYFGCELPDGNSRSPAPPVVP